MKKYNLIALVVLVFPAFLFLEYVLVKSLLPQYIYHVEVKLISGILIKSLITFFFLFIIVKKKLRKFNGLEANFKKFRSLILVMGLYLLIFLFKSHFLEINIYLLSLFLVSTILTGLAEEFCFRGVVLPLFIKTQLEKNHTIYRGVLLSALLFAGLHFLSLFKQPDNLIGVSSQVISAFFISWLFSALLLKIGNIITVGFYHGLINFTLGGEILKSNNQLIEQATGNISVNLNSIISTSILLLIVFVSALIIIRNLNSKEIIVKLNG